MQRLRSLRNLLTSLLFIVSLNANAKLLDRIIAVINERIITQSEINRISQTIPARKEISSFIFPKESYTNSELLQIVFQTYIIRDKLTAIGYVITDDSVESRIQMTEKKLGLRREDLLEFLNKKGITFDEYFELMRESMEYNIFISKIIHPLIAITDQEIKNSFYKNHDSNTLSFTYHLIDYSISKNEVSDTKDFVQKIKNFTITGIIEDKYKSFEATDLGISKEDDLSKDLSTPLKKLGEGEYSNAILLGNHYHVFFIKNKDLSESSIFLKNKQNIYDQLFNTKAESVKRSWLDREVTSYYTKNLLKWLLLLKVMKKELV